MAYKKFSVVFFIILLLHLYFLGTAHDWLIGISKNIILTSLIVFWITQTDLKTSMHKWIFAALVFCFSGDLLLQFVAFSEIYFILGLAAFLVAHVCYSVGFVAEQNSKITLNMAFLKRSFVPIIIGAAMVLVLWPHLGALKLPVLLYAFSIAAMFAIALNRSKKPHKSFNLVAAGAFLFVLSDAILGYNKFVSSVPLASYFIMFTYACANFLLVMGLLFGTKNKMKL